ncbi:MAG: acylneuraminate cytidylyltransferase family protein [Anaerolineaceae bacterium]|nr:acylneuraminate cytidylyltransferase family protein [Betaproteobacteria bacterium]
MKYKNVVAVIHARGGSVRVPMKNIRLLHGKPLIVWTIEAAINSNCGRVIVSTDHDEIAEISKKAGADVPFRRPPDISKDVASELVTQHAISFHENELGEKVDIAVTIQPTTPFLTADDINGCVDMLMADNNLESCFTAGPVHQRPEWMFHRDENGHAKKYIAGLLQGDMGISQLLPPLWHPNGGAYATRRQTLFGQNVLIGESCGIQKMTDMASVDIDNEIDFVIAEAVAKKLGLS